MQVEHESTVGVQDARQNLRDLIDAALEQGQHTVITRNMRPVAVLVPYSWYAKRIEERS